MTGSTQRFPVAVVPVREWDVVDQESWSRAFKRQSLFHVSSKLSRTKPEKMQVMEAAFGRWVGFIRSMGRGNDSAAVSCLTDDQDLMYAFVEALGAVAPCTARGYLTNLRTVCQGFEPAGAFATLSAATRYFWKTAKPVTSKRERMVPARELYELGLTLMRTAHDQRALGQRAAQFRDGLMIAVLIAAPVRLNNFCSIDIGKHLFKENDCYRVVFDTDEVKMGGFVDAPLPQDLSRFIDEWLEVYRPRCLAGRGRWYREHNDRALWISNSGAPFASASHIRTRIERRTVRAFGKVINPHLFRAIAATCIAEEMPEHVGIVASVLGHRRIETSEKHYIRANSIQGSMALQAIIADTVGTLRFVDYGGDVS